MKPKIVFHILTLFPNMFQSPFEESIIKRALERGIIDIKIHNLREWGIGKYKQVDDTPYGGGAGMVMKVDILDTALQAIKLKVKKSKTILLTPQGEKLTQKKVRSLATENKDLIFICGHYEGFDDRIRSLVDEEISIGDYVLTGGELPAMVLVDAVSRLVPGVLGKEESAETESFEENLLEYPQYTRPEEYKGMKVPV
ncbi:MAG: tRNA (guanosine(37)-N1)-methyltransferase TrmD, partial [Patescibacteria group bacterium]|nr:tRNA (guanosine(37)-N1)-methyltransferase TrmD [Patescibacteria group bacterium]